MRILSIVLTYYTIDQLIDLIDEPNRGKCKQILNDHRELFERARGSTHNHQTWTGEYIDHVTDGMNYAIYLYALEEATGRPLSFSLSDVLLIFFLHDLEKPWRILVDNEGKASNKAGLENKEQYRNFRENELRKYGIVLNEMQHNALTYVEGELKDYSSERRVMNELASFCHRVDVWSARERYDYPKAEDDEWKGARRFRTVSTMGDNHE